MYYLFYYGGGLILRMQCQCKQNYPHIFLLCGYSVIFIVFLLLLASSDSPSQPTTHLTGQQSVDERDVIEDILLDMVNKVVAQQPAQDETDVIESALDSFDGQPEDDLYVPGIESQMSLSEKSEYPDVWTPDQWTAFKSKHNWLIAKGGCLGCSICPILNSSSAAVKKSDGMTLLRANAKWVSCEITYNGSTRPSQLKSLRKKISDHASSSSHDKAVSIKKEAGEQKLERVVDQINSRAFSTTGKCFVTAYKMAKAARPFLDYEEDISMQMINGVDLGRILHSDSSAREITRHISSQMKKEVLQSIIGSDKQFAVLLDESTTLSTKSALIIYLRAALDKCPVTFLLDLVELDNGGTAEAIKNSLLACLAKHGLTTDVLKNRWLAITTDGCSTMLGRKAGLHTLLRKEFPRLISWHCAAHRLELAVADGLKAVTSTNHFKIFLEKLHNVFSMSPKNQRELQDLSSDLESQMLKIGGIFTIRWVASSLRTVKAIWNSYNVLQAFFKKATDDTSRSSKERETFRSLYTHLTSEYFVTNLGLMYDCLEELASLSLSLQENNINIVQGHNKILITRQAFVAL